ncbi:hypothetical protein U9M48_002372 [Paspalum notatum var. saurae]|uniref:F-box/LRR-repeat protein 15/At3g58940/PEG3-like LRR domain-containing protein n=1 Tax=Paspalum notatum var. saurae TaxID=547442 RepID=A0AAQ3SJ06_PASNO
MLFHVMYFLTLQEAVQTSLLSRRWQNLWSSLMWITVDAAKFSSIRTFKNFIDNLILYRSSLPVPVPLDVFFMSAICNNCDDSLEYSDIHPWIRHALDSNAWALGIMKHSGPKALSMEGYAFPFTSMHLKILGLCNCYIDDCFVQNLSSCCPVLDALDLMSCAIHVTMFSSTTLESLSITSTQIEEDYPEEFQYLVIDMPNLILSALSNANTLELVSASVFEDSGDDDYERLPNADAEIDPPNEEAVTTFSCEKLRKIKIYRDRESDKRAQIVVRILSAHLSPLPVIKINSVSLQLDFWKVSSGWRLLSGKVMCIGIVSDFAPMTDDVLA